MSYKEIIKDALYVTPVVAGCIISVWTLASMARELWAVAPEFVTGAIVVSWVSFMIAVVITIVRKARE